MASLSVSEGFERPYVSTGHLPTSEVVQSLVEDAHQRFRSDTSGKNSDVYPALARVPSELFGVCVVGTSGRVYSAGDVDREFSIMSVSKPFVFALICETIGPERARAKLGANATGLPFNSLAAIENGSGCTVYPGCFLEPAHRAHLPVHPRKQRHSAPRDSPRHQDQQRAVR